VSLTRQCGLRANKLLKMQKLPPTLAKCLAASVLAAVLLAMWGHQITGSPISRDAAQSLQMAINLERHGVLSMEPEAPFVATNYREPLPPIVSAVAVKLIDSLAGDAPAEAYFSGLRAQYVKYQNLLWLGLFSLSVFWVAQQLTSSFAISLIAVALVNVPFRPHVPPGPVDTLMTEIPSLWLLVAASGALALGFVRQKPWMFGVSGLLFGALTLVKAIGLYVFLGVVAVLPCFYFFRRRTAAVRPRLRDVACLVFAFAGIVGPWMYRNHVQVGTFRITQRAGESMFERSLEDQISKQEYVGAIYVWAPVLQRPLGAWLGFSARDLLRGGRLQRLEDKTESALSQEDLAFEDMGAPEKTVTFYRRARAEREKLEHALEVAGVAHPDVEADAMLESRALATFAEHPWRHLALCPLFLWRGGLLTMLILIAVLLCAFWQRRYDLALFALPTFGMVVSYALFSPFFPRYDLPMHLVAILLVVITAKLLWDATVKEVRPRDLARDAQSSPHAETHAHS
jgi:hypothetical protein